MESRPAHPFANQLEKNGQESAVRPFAWTFLVSLIFLGSLARIAAVFHSSPLEVLTTDPGRWWEEATHLSTIQPIAAIDAFGYPLWLGLFIKLTGGGALAIALHNAALSLTTPWIWHRLIREITHNRNIALAAWATFCWVPAWISIYSYTMSETLFLPLFGFALWLSVRAYRDPSTPYCFLAALIWALASATRVFALPFALVLLLSIVWKSSRRGLKLGYVVLAFALIATPLSIRTHHILGVWHPFGFPRMNQIYMESGNRTLHFEISRPDNYIWIYEFGSPSLYSEPLRPLSHWRSARTGFVSFSIDERNGAADWDRAMQMYTGTWHRRLKLWAENYLFFNFASSWPDDNPARIADEAAIVTRWCWLPLAIMVVSGNLLYRRYLRIEIFGVFALLTTLAWILTPLLPAVMEGRYRKPVEGLLIVNLFLLFDLRRRLAGSFSFRSKNPMKPSLLPDPINRLGKFFSQFPIGWGERRQALCAGHRSELPQC